MMSFVFGINVGKCHIRKMEYQFHEHPREKVRGVTVMFDWELSRGSGNQDSILNRVGSGGILLEATLRRRCNPTPDSNVCETAP